MASSIPHIDEEARRRFESAWLAGNPLRIDQCVASLDSDDGIATLQELICIELEFAWKLGKTSGPLVDDYMLKYPRLRRADLLLPLVQQEFEVRHRFGDRPSWEVYQRRFPDLIHRESDLRGDAPQTQGENHDVAVTVASQHGLISSLPPGGHVSMETMAMPLEGRARYTLTRLHAEGGLGRVWIARDADLNRDVALKELKPSPAKHPESCRRFLKEAQVTGQLEHPNIVPVYELGRRPEDNQPFYTMRFVHGQTLRDAIGKYHDGRKISKENPVEWLRLLQAFVSVCNAVSYAHSRGVIHRDLKPDNVILGDFGEVLVLDWGLAKTGDMPDERATPVDFTQSVTQLRETAVGHVLGSPAYMAPEQAEGRVEHIDARTDVYGLGAMLFEIVTGKPPHLRGDTRDILGQIIREPTPEARSIEPATPRALDAICSRAMAKDRADRYPAVAELSADVQRYLADEPVSVYHDRVLTRMRRFVRRRRVTVAVCAATLAGLLLSALVGFVIWRNNENQRRQDAADRLVRATTSAKATEALVLSELRQGNYAPVDDFLSLTVSRLADKPELSELSAQISGEYDRLHRISQFYKLVNEAERFECFEYDDQAADACESALNMLGVLKEPMWWTHLPIQELSDEQQERLKEEVLRQLLLLSALRAKPGLGNPTDPKNGPAYHSALETIAAAQRWRPTLSARMLEVFCRMGLGGDEAAKLQAQPPWEATSGADYYFLGLMQYRVSQTNDESVAAFLKLAQPLTGVDFSDSLEQSSLLLRRSASIDPKHYWTYFWLGRSRMSVKHFPGAELSFDCCIALHPNYAIGYAYRGWSLIRESHEGKDPVQNQKLAERGLADLVRARAIEPNQPEFIWLQGQALAERGKLREGLAAMVRATELEAPLENWAGRRVYADKQHNLQEMFETAKKWSDDDPRSVDAWVARAAAARALGERKGAEAAVARALDLNPNQPTALAVRGTMAVAQKRYDAAQTDFRAALSAKGNLWSAAYGLVNTSEAQASPEEALSAFDDLIRIAETDWQKLEVHLGRARLLKRLGRKDEAEEAMARVREIDPRAGVEK